MFRNRTSTELVGEGGLEPPPPYLTTYGALAAKLLPDTGCLYWWRRTATGSPSRSFGSDRRFWSPLCPWPPWVGIKCTMLAHRSMEHFTPRGSRGTTSLLPFRPARRRTERLPRELVGVARQSTNFNSAVVPRRPRLHPQPRLLPRRGRQNSCSAVTQTDTRLALPRELKELVGMERVPSLAVASYPLDWYPGFIGSTPFGSPTSSWNFYQPDITPVRRRPQISNLNF